MSNSKADFYREFADLLEKYEVELYGTETEHAYGLHRGIICIDFLTEPHDETLLYIDADTLREKYQMEIDLEPYIRKMNNDN
jgi:outer membrane lipoprotein-sorting protein